MIKETKYSKYYVSDTGKVYSNKTGKMKELKQEQHKSGYLYVNVYIQGKRKHVRVHRLIAETFLNNPNNYPVINHKNGIKNDNNINNLEWCDMSYNTKDAYNQGFAKNDKSFNDSQSLSCIAIRLKDNKKFIVGSCREASKKLNISVSTITRQIKGITKIDYRLKYKFKKYMECNDYPIRE